MLLVLGIDFPKTAIVIAEASFCAHDVLCAKLRTKYWQLEESPMTATPIRSKTGNSIIRTVAFDDVSWEQAHEMAKEEGINLSALIRMAVRQQYKLRKMQ